MCKLLHQFRLGLASVMGVSIATIVSMAAIVPERALAQSSQVLLRETAQAGPIVVERVAGGLENPWGFAFMPDGRILVTERPGRLRIVSAQGIVSPALGGVPRVAARGQGGLLDVALDPKFAENRLIYLSYAEPRSDGAGTAVLKAKLNLAATALEAPEVIFRQQPSFSGGNHFGSRLAFGDDGSLFVTLGDRYGLRDKAQDLSTHMGKVVRINADGSVPKDNPFAGRNDAKPEIWSYGHRNPQSAAIHPLTRKLWTVEHGAKGGDEINVPAAGKNYGWPVITYGVDYSGATIGEGTAKSGMEQPIFYWDPSIAPSGMAFYTGDKVPAWRGNLFVGALAGTALVRLSLDGERITGEERLLKGLNERIRDVRQGPDGLLYIITDDAKGQVLRIRPGT
jgi:aldose sugar dehydrogenase